ncbi:TonB-dependent receptor [Jeongeupia naejangsanensis]|uniref:TonB-dependent receptor n=1 Tax=Jeongeupia naejangsanensis TaxID=613195 RepID=A0ABS2BNL3_9NEIS|nr:TonB-dependent receptor [Jeongeupia naejangsanensis]MBM3117222.1 TonB-dependent receptor [Jeongeupia naejangsanensis]
MKQPHTLARRCALAVAVASAFVYANDTPLLDEVVVSGSREATPLKETAAAIGKVDAKAIADAKPTSISQVLDTVPGVLMPDLGNEQHSMAIRQPISTRPLYQYLEDGIPIRPVGVFNHNATYEINLDGEDSIEVMRGPASSLYGSNAVGGAVNFISRAPSSTLGGDIALRGSNQGYSRVDAEVTGGNDVLASRLSGYRSWQRDGWQDYSDADKTSLTLRSDLTLSDVAYLKTLFSYNKLDTDMPGSLNPSDYNSRPGFSYQSFTYRNVEAMRAYAQLIGNWNEGGETTTSVYWRHNNTDQLPSYLIFNTGPASASGRTTENFFSSVGIDTRHRQDWGPLRLIGGATLEESPNDQGEWNLAVQRDPASGRYLSYRETTRRRDYHVDLSNAAVYGEAQWAISRAWRATAGLRWDRVGYDYSNNLSPSATTGAPSQEQTFSHTSPKLGLTWQTSDSVSTYASYSQGFTPPEVGQLFSSLAVPDLKPATYNNVEIGLRAQLPYKTSLELALYQLDGDDEIVNYSSQPGKSEPRNAGRTRHRGVELGLNGALAEVWQWRLSGSYAQHEYRDYQATPQLNYAGKTMAQAPNWFGNAALAWLPVEKARLALEVQYVGPYWMNDANTVRYDGHTLLNLRANWGFARGWEAWASVINLTDRHYAESASSTYSGTGVYSPDAQDTYTPGAPRTALVGVRYAFGGEVAK